MRRTALGLGGAPAGCDEGPPDGVGDLVGAGADQPGRKAQDPVAAGPDLVLPTHVVRPLPGVHVVRAVDLDLHPPLSPVRVQPAVAARRVDPMFLKIRDGQPMPATEAQEVDLGERLRAAGDVIDGLLDQVPARCSGRTSSTACNSSGSTRRC